MLAYYHLVPLSNLFTKGDVLGCIRAKSRCRVQIIALEQKESQKLTGFMSAERTVPKNDMPFKIIGTVSLVGALALAYYSR
jgi:hypothetical protein